MFYESHVIILPIPANKTLQLWNPANCLSYKHCRFPFVAGRSVLAGVSAAIPEACRDEQRWGNCFSKTQRADALPLELQRFSFINQPTLLNTTATFHWENDIRANISPQHPIVLALFGSVWTLWITFLY